MRVTSDMGDSLAEGNWRIHNWAERTNPQCGHCPSPEDLAHSKGVDRSYAGRLLKLTSLAPEIVEAVLAGQERVGLSLRQLRRGIPLAWEEQRELWA
jgi:hypothetical protein